MQALNELAPTDRAEERVAPAGDIVVILNPVSCPDGPVEFERAISELLGPFNRNVQFVHTSESNAALPIAEKAVADGTSLVIAAGGDGTVMGAINGLIGSGVPIGIIPLGTGNLLAGNLGVPLGLSDAVEVAMTGVAQPIDLVSVDGGGRYFAIMGGLGYDAHIMEQTERSAKQKFGRLAYIASALKMLQGHRFAALVTLDDRPPIVVRAKSVLVSNLGQLTPGLNLFDQTSPDDGLIEVGILKASRIGEFLRLIWRAIVGSPSDDPTFDTYQVRRVQIETRRPQAFELDGEPIGRIEKVDMAVTPRPVSIMVPAKVKSRLAWSGKPSEP